MMQFLRDLLTLSKAGISLFVALTCAMGYVLAGGTVHQLSFWLAVIGTGLVSASAGAFNQVLERRQDARMVRTRHRPIPAGRMQPYTGLGIGLLLFVIGEALLFKTGEYPPLFASLAWFIYIGIYTPLKRFTWWSNLAGAVAGAIPPVIGWSVLRSPFEHGAFIIFSILWLWQWPHLVAISWMFKEDMARAGFPVPDTGKGEGMVSRFILLSAVSSWFVALLPYFFKLAGLAYLILAFSVGAIYAYMTFRFLRMPEGIPAQSLFKTSLVYLAVICLALMGLQSR